MTKTRLTFIIFSAIGIFNTLFDIALYVVIYNATHSIITANIIATSAALIGSYLLNSRITFKSRRWTAKSFALFIAVTVFGLWILQTIVIYALNPLFTSLPDGIWNLFGPLEQTARTVLPKLFATVVTFIWNFVWYNKVIFKTNTVAEQAAIALD